MLSLKVWNLVLILDSSDGEDIFTESLWASRSTVANQLFTSSNPLVTYAENKDDS